MNDSVIEFVRNSVKLMQVTKQCQYHLFSDLQVLTLKFWFCCNLLQSTKLLCKGQNFTAL